MLPHVKFSQCPLFLTAEQQTVTKSVQWQSMCAYTPVGGVLIALATIVIRVF
jgi:hypothetical protein